MPRKTATTGRQAQRRRTRHAILAAATELLAQGQTPTVAEVADAADVSRRTVYMHFPTLEQLFIDATLGAIARDTIDPVLAAPDDDDDVEARVERLARAAQQGAAATEQQGRTLMRLTAGGAKGRTQPPRGFRRVEWIERALAPLRPKLPRAQFERLVTSLAMVVGWEALIVQRDIRGLSVKKAEDVSAWAARALVRATLDELKRRR